MLQNDGIRSEREIEKRNGLIDGLRFVGAIGIVWFNSSMPGAWLGYSALLAFVTLYIVFFFKSLKSKSTSEMLRDKAQRLLVPWIGWSLIYGLAKIADAVVSNLPISSEFELWMVFTGPAIHLWFLPFVFIFGFIAFLLNEVKYPLRKWYVLNGLFVFSAFWSIWQTSNSSLDIPFAQWVFVFPAATFGLLLAGCDISSARALKLSVLNIGIFASSMAIGWPSLAPQLLIGNLVTLAVLQFKAPAPHILRSLGDISLGIYLVHPLILTILARFFAVPEKSWLILSLTIFLSTASTMIMKRLPLARAIV